MSKSTDIRIKSVTLQTVPVVFRMPLKFGGRVIDKTFLIEIDVTVESRDGKRHATGTGSMPVGNVWAWPSTTLNPEQTSSLMLKFSEEVVELAGACKEFGHPIDLAYHLSAEYAHLGKVVSQNAKIPELIPELAELVAASPFDAALHDAYGRLHGANSYDLLSSKYMNYDLAYYLDDQFAGEYLDQYTLRKPKERMPIYHLIGALDPLTSADVKEPINDGLPVTLPEWINTDGLTHLKIKLSGEDPAWDLDRIVAIEKVVAPVQEKRGCKEWFYSLDFNEKCPSPDTLLELLKKLQAASPDAFRRTQYIEQPTARDLKKHPEHKMHEVAKLKPVVIDESLIDYDSLLLSRELGYSGCALKACKGHTEALLMGAAAQKFGLFLCVQDLTCPGYSFLHSASLSARIPAVAAIEGNARQYCPSANKVFAKAFPTMFHITDGTVGTGILSGPGLGF